MLAEALNFAATYALSGRRRAGEINSSVRLWARARRCAADWAPHEENSRAVILDAVKDLRQRRTAVVLGSGLLRDVPIDALAASFDTVVLVDLVHLASVRLRLALKGRRNVRLIERDLRDTTSSPRARNRNHSPSCGRCPISISSSRRTSCRRSASA